MKFVNYQIEKEYLDRYSELIKDINNDYPLFAKTKVEEIKKIFNRKNPFLKFGSWQNFLLFDKGKPVAHISTILDRRLPIDTGLIGYFDSLNNTNYALEIFDIAINFLSKNGKKVVKGPINITTWQSIRVAYPETNSPFFLEPFTRSYYRDLFKDYGFKVAQHNISTVQEVEKTNFDKFEKEFKNLKDNGFIFEAIDSKHFLTALPELYNLAIKIFADTYSFIKIDKDEFIYSFSDFLKVIDKCFLYIVRNQKKKGIAFLFGISDFYLTTGKRVILKITGVLPEYQNLGIGSAMFYIVYRSLKEKCISKVIFSTIRDDNTRIKELTGFAQNIYREYEVFELTL